MPMNPGWEVYSACELARAARVPAARVRELIETGAIRAFDGEYVTHAVALDAVRRLLPDAARDSEPSVPLRPLLGPLAHGTRRRGLPLTISSATHALLIGGIVLATSGHANSFDTMDVPTDPEPVRLVYLTTPGPGGGGGGGGRREPTPPPRAEREGASVVSSPVPARELPAPIEPAPAPEPPPVLESEPMPPVVAPVVAVEGDQQDRAGILEEARRRPESHGPGEGGGAGDGRGTGVGEGDGSGIGPGSGGGVGGGPFRPGSGILPPRLLREVKPDYTEAARRAGIEGDVVLEIVVRRDGSVGPMRVIRSLPHGLDRQAMAAVRQWRFEPATRLGSPVDVIVEVAVEFQQR